ncbi:MAG: hypothetical protein VR66_22155 [Peptococcaceae bacterium BRH_c23]|nr:MAG: hypothetical protein VR66_22155 [Peptococcaceae bacterium BRH_c23]KJS87852.1 MAG: hypothetical protein JL57_13310 [Desulfosporosinus sp. BICA1-9]
MSTKSSPLEYLTKIILLEIIVNILYFIRSIQFHIPKSAQQNKKAQGGHLSKPTTKKSFSFQSIPISFKNNSLVCVGNYSKYLEGKMFKRFIYYLLKLHRQYSGPENSQEY